MADTVDIPLSVHASILLRHSLGADTPAMRPRPAVSRLRSTPGLDLDDGARRGSGMAGSTAASEMRRLFGEHGGL
jgi:hypothetical protein